MKKLLITGGNGVIGHYFSSLFNPDSYVAPSKHDMPVDDARRVLQYVYNIQPSAIVHMAAITDVDFCESHPHEAHRVNVLGTEHIVSACKHLRVPLVYISSAAVFDGEKPHYVEHDVPGPVNVYGETKYKSEQIIQQSGIDFMIVRIGWLIGGGKKEKKFVSYIFEKLKNGTDVQAVSDIHGSVVYAPDVIAFIRDALAKHLTGIYHVGYTGTPSRYDIALELKRLLKSTSQVFPVPAQLFTKTFHAARPKHEVLVSTKLPFTVHWKERLRDYVMSELI